MPDAAAPRSRVYCYQADASRWSGRVQGYESLRRADRSDHKDRIGEAGKAVAQPDVVERGDCGPWEFGIRGEARPSEPGSRHPGQRVHIGVGAEASPAFIGRTRRVDRPVELQTQIPSCEPDRLKAPGEIEVVGRDKAVDAVDTGPARFPHRRDELGVRGRRAIQLCDLQSEVPAVPLKAPQEIDGGAQAEAPKQEPDSSM